MRSPDISLQASHTDLHFRSMRRLVADDITEPVPIATNNTTIIRHHAYESVFDYLSREGCNVEAVPKQKFDPGNDDWDDLDENISEAIGKLDEDYLKTYIHWALNGEGNDEIITKAIETVRLHLSVLHESFEYTPKNAGPTYNVSMYQWFAHYQARKAPLLLLMKTTTHGSDMRTCWMILETHWITWLNY